MYTDIFKNFSEQTEKTFGPMMKYNQLVADNFTALTNLQLDAARQYADIGLAQLQAGSQVKDVQSLVSSGAKQLETMTRVSQQMMEDGKKLADLAQEFKSGLEALAADAQKK
ncbi:phasin family protein [Oceanisphaera psychrotolerans]|uniref:Phasin family protein n=1 Tax=Oceanisphaera psychrotolerans TaxID=1414654 RepID=A0A1J4QGR3_9GAMM|nr:phasin family protein [Oceanisphaera psychrotolerans]OIN13097.1 phasin family protein [Oceanisphaera psychrotolerans]